MKTMLNDDFESLIRSLRSMGYFNVRLETRHSDNVEVLIADHMKLPGELKIEHTISDNSSSMFTSDSRKRYFLQEASRVLEEYLDTPIRIMQTIQVSNDGTV